MTSPVQQVSVQCPACDSSYETSYRASINLQLDAFSDAYVEEIMHGVCPRCGHRVRLTCLVVAPDGVWHLSP